MADELILKLEKIFPKGYPTELIELILRQMNQSFLAGKESGRLEALTLISEKEGWEETRDIYAEKLGLPTKYK